MVKSLKERKGKYGMAKYRAFASLEYREWVSSRELVLLAGLKYTSTGRLLPRWVDYGYLERQLSYVFGAGTFKYRLADRGRGWLAVARRDLPMASKFEDDLKAWQMYITPEIPRLMTGKFKEVIAVLEEAV